MNFLFCPGYEHLHDRCAQQGHGGQDDPTEGRVCLLLQLAVTAATQVGNENNVELFRNMSLQMRLRDVEIVMLFTNMHVSPDGITRRVTVLQTSVTRSSSTATSTLETLQGLSSPPSRTGDCAA